MKSLPQLELRTEEHLHNLHTIAEGWAFPLNRFMSEQELIESLNMNTITHGGKKHLMSVPLTQDITADQKKEFEGKPRVAVTWEDKVVAVINEPEIYDNRKEEICTKTFGTRSVKHPKIKNIEAQGDFLISGKSMEFTSEIKYNDGLDQYRLKPNEIAEIA